MMGICARSIRPPLKCMIVSMIYCAVFVFVLNMCGPFFVSLNWGFPLVMRCNLFVIWIFWIFWINIRSGEGSTTSRLSSLEDLFKQTFGRHKEGSSVGQRRESFILPKINEVSTAKSTTHQSSPRSLPLTDSPLTSCPSSHSVSTEESNGDDSSLGSSSIESRRLNAFLETVKQMMTSAGTARVGDESTPPECISKQNLLNFYVLSPCWSEMEFDGTRKDVTRALSNWEEKYVEEVPRKGDRSDVFYPTKGRKAYVKVFFEHTLIAGGKVSDKVAVYKMLGRSKNLVTKYQLYCYSKWLDPVEPMLLESWFLNFLKDTGITHKLIYLSGSFEVAVPGKLSVIDCYNEYEKIVNPDEVLENTQHRGNKIRYMITERVGMSLMRHLYGGFPQFTMVESFKLTIQMIDLIEKLHSFGIIHNDAHMGNFVNRGDGYLIIIDFGRARIFDQNMIDEIRRTGGSFKWPGYTDAGDSETNESMWLSLFLSKWEVNHYIEGFRDDVSRIIQTLPFLMYGVQYSSALNNLAQSQLGTFDDPQYLGKFYRYKQYGNYFETTISWQFEKVKSDGSAVFMKDRAVFSLDNVPDESVRKEPSKMERLDEVRSHLAKVLHYSRLPSAVDQKAYYYEIRKYLYKAIKALEPEFDETAPNALQVNKLREV